MPLAPQSQRSTAAAAFFVYIAMAAVQTVSAGHKVVQLKSRNSAAAAAPVQPLAAAADSLDGEAAGTPTSTYGEQQRRLQVQNQGYSQRIVDARKSMERVKMLGMNKKAR